MRSTSLPFSLAKRATKRSAESDYVASAFPERGNCDRKDVQAVEQVFAELAVGHHLREVLVCGRYDPDVDLYGLIAADSLEAALLQDAQEFCLQGKLEFADFVKEYRAAVGLLEAPDALGAGPGESALLMSEELAFNEVFR